MRWSEIYEEGAVGVVANNKKQAKDPRYSMSMTNDVKPGETQRQAAKFGNKLDKKGHPPTLSKKVKGASTNVAFNLGLTETIRKQGDKYVIYSKDGKKKLGTYDSRKAAEKRLGQIEYFKHKESIEEGEFRANDVEEFKPDNKALDNLKSKYLPDWEMLDHRTLQAKYVADDHRAAVAFVKIINSLSEQMDHFCEVTQDVAEVTVKTTTFDVKGLTILDFQIAMVIDRFANDVGIKQVPMSGNFGMHENFADGKVKGKSRPGRVKKAGASCSGSVTKLRKQAKNASGEKAKMYHWCANMKSGKKK